MRKAPSATGSRPRADARPPARPYPAEAGRYHLHVAWNRPWAHRALLTRVLKGLQDAITVSHARPRRTGDGWVYDSDGPFACPEPGVRALHEVHARQDPPCTGGSRCRSCGTATPGASCRAKAPTSCGCWTAPSAPRCRRPPTLEAEIDAWNAVIHAGLNNGV